MFLSSHHRFEGIDRESPVENFPSNLAIREFAWQTLGERTVPFEWLAHWSVANSDPQRAAIAPDLACLDWTETSIVFVGGPIGKSYRSSERFVILD